jgi:hypothetical protein
MTFCEMLYRKRVPFQQTEEFKNEYPQRCKIENKQAEMVHHGLRQSRYIWKSQGLSPSFINWRHSKFQALLEVS